MLRARELFTTLGPPYATALRPLLGPLYTYARRHVRRKLRVAASLRTVCDCAAAMADEMAAMWCRKKLLGDVRDVPY